MATRRRDKIKRKRKASKTTGERRLKNTSGKKGSADSGDAEDEPLPKKQRLAKKESTKYKSAKIVADSDDDSVLQQTEMELEKADSPCSDRDGVEHDSDVGGVSDKTIEDEEPETSYRYRRQKQSRRTRIVGGSDEDE